MSAGKNGPVLWPSCQDGKPCDGWARLLPDASQLRFCAKHVWRVSIFAKGANEWRLGRMKED